MYACMRSCVYVMCTYIACMLTCTQCLDICVYLCRCVYMTCNELCGRDMHRHAMHGDVM